MARPSRLLVALLILMLALPAMPVSALPAMPLSALPALPAAHATPTAMPLNHAHHDLTGMMDRDEQPQPHHSPTAAHHECIGCIAPLDIRLYRPARAPAPAFALQGPALDPPAPMLRASAPETPPPRLLA